MALVSGGSLMLADQAWQGLFEMPQLVIILAFLLPIVGIIAFYWYKAQKARSENELKRTLVDRGLSVDEIERILAAHPDEPRDSRR
jgi:protein-S-isoprenylcysteine O-methyltransferase Ste14